MTDEAGGNGARQGAGGVGVLRRYLQARNGPAMGEALPDLPHPPPPTASRAAAVAIARAADQLYHLGMQVHDLRSAALTLAEMPELLPEPALLAVLQGTQDRIGVMALCPEMVTALIEMQTMGRVTRREIARRRPTRSDALLCADFVDCFLRELAVEMDGVEGFDRLSGYRYASFLDDVRPLMLMLDDQPYRSFGFDLGLGGNLRRAQVFLALPQGAMAEDHSPVSEGARPAADGRLPEVEEIPDSKGAIGFDISRAPLKVFGVLARRRMNLREVRALQAGKTLNLPISVLSEAQLETRDGQILARGKLGEFQGCHAIRLHAAADGIPPQEELPEPHFAVANPTPIHDLLAPDEFRPEPLQEDGLGEVASNWGDNRATKTSGTA